MTTDTPPSATIAGTLEANETIQRSIQAIVDQVREAGATLTGARPPTAELVAGLEQWLDRAAEVRGKGALYPYVGSGAGNGPLVELADGSVKWDMINGIGVHMFGHGDPDLIGVALRGALADTIMQGNLQFNAESIKFAELLVAEASKTSRLRHAFVTNSGAMANESALKICMQRNSPASRVIAFADCFMGRSLAMAQIGDSSGGRVGLPLNMLVDYLPFYDSHIGERSIEHATRHLDMYLERYPGQHACFVMELIQGEGGFNQAPPEFFLALMERCRAAGVAIWADEIQTFGRTESMFHFEQLGLGEHIDVVTLGKMSQVCACLYTEDYNPKPGLLSGTFIGSSVGLEVGIETLTRLRDGGYYGRDGRIARLQEAFREHAHALVDKHPDWFPAIPHPWSNHAIAEGFYGGVGGMMRLTPFGGDRPKIMNALHAMFDEGVIAFVCGHGPYHIRFLPPVGVMKPEHFHDVFEILERALARAA